MLACNPKRWVLQISDSLPLQSNLPILNYSYYQISFLPSLFIYQKHCINCSAWWFQINESGNNFESSYVLCYVSESVVSTRSSFDHTVERLDLSTILSPDSWLLRTFLTVSCCARYPTSFVWISCWYLWFIKKVCILYVCWGVNTNLSWSVYFMCIEV